MYESFYGLSEKPFNLTPDPRYLFLSDKHKEAFAHLLFGIKNRCGFVMVTGEIGTGKTTICRTLLNQLDDETEVAFIFNPRLSPEDLLRTINEDFGIASKGETVKELIDELNAHLLERNAQGKNCVLVIDESQNLAPPVLEQIRLLSNLETETQKLMQIVLIGQPELAQNLALPELRQLNQRITARYHLKPLDRQETAQYIGHRLHTAGGHKKVRFTPGATKRVYRFSGGTPRVINAVCDRALLVGYTQEVRDITTAIVAKAAKEVRGEKIRVKRTPRPADTQPFPWKMVTAAAMVALMLGATLYGPLLLERSAWAPGILASNPQPPSADRRTDIVRAAVDDSLNESPLRAIAEEADPEALLDEVSAPTAFQRAVGRLEPELPRNAAAQAMLRAWRMAMVGDYPADDSTTALTAFAVQNGFDHETLQLTQEQLRAINLPAFVRMTTDRHPVWVAVVGATDEGLRVTTTMGETQVVDDEEFGKRYLGESVLVWRDSEANAPVLMAGSRGDSVRKLQEAMNRAGHYEGEASGIYDAATEQAVSALQASSGLAVDGKTGRQTRMAVAAWSGEPGIPVLAEPAVVEAMASSIESEAAAVNDEQPEVIVAESSPDPGIDSPDALDTLEASVEMGAFAISSPYDQTLLPGSADEPEAAAPSDELVSALPEAGTLAQENPDTAGGAAFLAAIQNEASKNDSSTTDALGTMFDALRSAVADDDDEAIADINASLEEVATGSTPDAVEEPAL